MGTLRKKHSKLTLYVSLFAIFSILISSVSIVFSSPSFAAPTAPSQASCEAAGGEWKNLAPTGGIPKMGCSGANVASQQPLDWQVKSLMYYRAIGKCFQQADRSSITYEKMQSGEWFRDGYVAIGPYFRDSFSDVGDDSVMSCSGDSGKELVKAALSLWGLKARDVLCGAGLTWNEFPNNTARCHDESIGDGNFLANKFWNNEGGANPGTDGYVSGKTANVMTYIKNELYGGATPDLTSAGWYTFYRKVFFQQCVTSQSMNDGSTTKPSGTDNRDVMLKIVSDTGEEQEKWFRVDASMGTNSFKTRIAGYPDFSDVNRTCQQVAAHVNEYANAYIFAITQNPSTVTPDDSSGSGTGAGEEGKTTCAIEGVGWIICPVVSFLASIADNAFTFLADSFLVVDVNTVSTSSGTYTAWTAMRNIANVIFVIAFMFIIFSQLTGQGVANYGIKKLLPRIVIAAILVNISFFVCQLAIDLSNVIGISIRDVFNSAGAAIETPKAIGDESGNWVGIAAAVIAGTGIAWALGLSVLLPFLLAAVVAFIMVFLILVVRQVLVVLLVVLAPVAFVAFLLPNTEQWFTKWRKMFVGLLLVFPLIGLLFGAAGLASTVINATAYSTDNDTSGWIMKIVAAGVIALPLFLLPSLLKGSLSAIPMIGNKLSGMTDKLSKNTRAKAASGYKNSAFGKFRSAKKAERSARVAAGTYTGAGGNFNPRNIASNANRALNTNAGFNKVTGGFGAQRDLAAQGQNRSDQKEAIDMFGGDDTLVAAWASSGGKKSHASYTSLGTAQKAQFDKMVDAGHHRKASSFLASAQYLSENGKGDSSDISQAFSHASAAGADATTIGGAEQAAIAAYRKSGRGDAVSALQTAANMRDPDPTKRVALSQEAAWSQISASAVHREAIKPGTASRAGYESYLNGNAENTRKALVGYDSMEARAQDSAQSAIIAAAQLHQYNATGATPTISGIQDAKTYFGVK